MTLTPEEREAAIDFTCTICERCVENRFPGPRQTQSFPPVCRYCETQWGSRQPDYGAFKDRRVAVQISAVANALESAARVRHYKEYGYAAP